jgi:hypothetical protein
MMTRTFVPKHQEDQKTKVFRPADEEIANKAHHSLCLFSYFKYLLFLNYEKSNRFELRQFCINT